MDRGTNAMKEATLQDVAKLAGVSAGTVSKYINGKVVSPKNREKIRSAIQLLEYTPSPLARNFASGKSYTILLYIIAESPIISSTWQYELPIVHGITDVLQGTMYSLRIEIAPVEDVEGCSQKLDSYTRGKYADGILLLSPWEIGEKLLLPLDYRNFPYAVIGGDPTTPRHGFINFDNGRPICEIVGEMADMGARRVGLIGGFREHLHMIDRARGFCEGLACRGIPVDEDLIRYGDFSLQSGYDCTREMLLSPDPPTAIVCGNDNIASGAVRAIKERGLRIPEDVLVSGFDDTIVSDATDPTISTVRTPSYEMGTLAARELLKRVENRDYVIPHHVVECEVIRKQSTRRK